MIAIVGQCVLDRIHEPGAPVVERLGGSPLFAGRALHAVGKRGIVLTKGGTPGLRAPLAETGFATVVGDAAGTFVSELEIYGDGERLHAVPAFGDPFTPEDVAGWMAPALARVRVVVAGAQWRDDFRGDTLSALAGAGRIVFLDGQGPARVPRLGPIELAGPLDPSWVTGVSVLKCSEEEALPLLGGTDANAVARADIPIVVVTRGHLGAVVHEAGRATAVAGAPVLGLADTVGAGDSFLALMAAAWDDGAGAVAAAQASCDGVSAILRARLERGA